MKREGDLRKESNIGTYRNKIEEFQSCRSFAIYCSRSILKILRVIAVDFPEVPVNSLEINLVEIHCHGFGRGGCTPSGWDCANVRRFYS